MLAALRDVRLGYGDHVAVRSIDLEVAAGTVVALVGGDGAGKTTVLRALAGRLRPVHGSLTLADGVRVGVVPAVGATWRDLTVSENVAFVGRAYGSDRTRADELLDRMGLGDVRDRLAGDLSGGMRQKLALAMALQHAPDLLVLDEPTTGVDPVSRADIWRLLGSEVAAGGAVVLATTYLDEAARATTVTIMDDGRVLARGEPHRLTADLPGSIVRGTQRLGARSWRRGRWWHSWLRDGETAPAAAAGPVERVTPDLEDAAIVAALQQEVAA